MPGRLTTIGYEGLIVDELVDQLRADGVEVVVDVRLNPISRKPGLSKTRLAAALDAVGIGYVHERALGNPPDNRAALRAGDADAWERLRAQLASAEAVAALERVRELASARVVALLCVEHDPRQCHRTLVAELVAERPHPD